MGYDNDNLPGPLVLDLETVAIDDVAELLDPVSAPSNYKDAAKIEAAKAEKLASQIERAALDANTCRIVALGWHLEPDQDGVLLCKTEAAERVALDHLCHLLMSGGGGCRRTITFNGLAFDLCVIEQRMRLLGLRGPTFDLRAWGMHTDLMQLLTCNGRTPTHSLRFFAKRYQLASSTPRDAAICTVTGADIGRLVAEDTPESWALIEGHCRYDVEDTTNLARIVHAL